MECSDHHHLDHTSTLSVLRHSLVSQLLESSSLLHQPVWMLGLLMMISGEVGNLAAYGDVGTPTSVITAVGCIGVLANLVIATMFLKEPFRIRDLLGGGMVVFGSQFATRVHVFLKDSVRACSSPTSAQCTWQRRPAIVTRLHVILAKY